MCKRLDGWSERLAADHCYDMINLPSTVPSLILLVPLRRSRSAVDGYVAHEIPRLRTLSQKTPTRPQNRRSAWHHRPTRSSTPLGTTCGPSAGCDTSITGSFLLRWSRRRSAALRSLYEQTQRGREERRRSPGLLIVSKVCAGVPTDPRPRLLLTISAIHRRE